MEIRNRKANYEYFILSQIECGIELKGTEIKSLRNGSADIRDAFGIIKNEEIYVINMFIAKYAGGNQFNHEERRTRRLLLHKNEIKRLKNEVMQDGVTLVPLAVYFKGNKAKLLLGLGKGKKNYDKRETIKKRDIERETRQKIS